MILVLLGTQNNSFHRLLEEIEEYIKDETITEKVVVQAGFTKFESDDMEIFDMIPQEKLDKLIDEASFVITHGGVGSIVQAVKKEKRIIAVPRLKKYGEHVNDHQKEIIETFKNQGLIIGINDVKDLGQALKDIENFNTQKQEKKQNKIITIIDDFIQQDIQKRKQKKLKKIEGDANGRRKNNNSKARK